MKNYTMAALAACTLLSVACNKGAENSTNTTTTPASTANMISCEGVDQVKLSLTEDDIVKLYGEANVKLDTAWGVEGSYLGYASFIHKGTPKEIEVAWADSDESMKRNGTFKKILFIRLTQPNSPYKTETGLQVGSTLTALEKVNGAPITFSGFGWDLGGAISNFNGGSIKCYNISLGLAENVNYDEFSAYMGDVQVSSSDAKLKKDLVTINEFTVFNR